MGYVEELRAIVGHRPLILVGAVVIIVNDKQEVLMEQRRHPQGVWGLPGGLMELGESVEDTARREVYEETGLVVGEMSLLGVFSGSDYFVTAANGDEFYVVTNSFVTSQFQGTLVRDVEESLDLSFFDILNLPQSIVRSHRMMLERYAHSFAGL